MSEDAKQIAYHQEMSEQLERAGDWQGALFHAEMAREAGASAKAAELFGKAARIQGGTSFGNASGEIENLAAFLISAS